MKNDLKVITSLKIMRDHLKEVKSKIKIEELDFFINKLNELNIKDIKDITKTIVDVEIDEIIALIEDIQQEREAFKELDRLLEEVKNIEEKEA